MLYVVTGAAGFIGSNLIAALNARGERNILAVDNLAPPDKFRNLVGLQIADYMDKREFLERLENGQFDDAIDVFFHQGACSNTMETDGRYMMENNYRYSLAVLDHCLVEEVPLIYASSAAVYGGASVFREDPSCELPLNVYGYSKLLFDLAVRRRLVDAESQVAGFRYFNVYGPNEDHKARMASVAWHFFHQFRADGCVRPFTGSGGYVDGEQRRDFIHVDDVVKINLHFLEHPEASGIFNAGTGRAQSFNDVACAVVNTCRAEQSQAPLDLANLHREGFIRYNPFPEALKGKYQHFTEADIGALKATGYHEPFLPVERGVESYVGKLLKKI